MYIEFGEFIPGPLHRTCPVCCGPLSPAPDPPADDLHDISSNLSREACNTSCSVRDITAVLLGEDAFDDEEGGGGGG